VSERHDHWAVGWVDGYALRVYRDGAITDAFRKYCELRSALADYPVLDEEDYSRRELEATFRNIENVAGRFVKDNAPEDWVAKVYDVLPDSEKENRDDQGGYPSREALKAALSELDLLDANYVVLIDDVCCLETDSRIKAENEYDTLAYHASMGIGLAADKRLTLLRDDETIDIYPEEHS
jgi:hypothetical protein